MIDLDFIDKAKGYSGLQLAKGDQHVLLTSDESKQILEIWEEVRLDLASFNSMFLDHAHTSESAWIKRLVPT